MKTLKIKSSNCLLNKNNYGVSINNLDINNLVLKNLPESLENYRDYPVEFTLQVEFLGGDNLEIATEGYEVKGEENKESEVQG